MLCINSLNTVIERSEVIDLIIYAKVYYSITKFFPLYVLFIVGRFFVSVDLVWFYKDSKFRVSAVNVPIDVSYQLVTTNVRPFPYDATFCGNLYQPDPLPPTASCLHNVF